MNESKKNTTIVSLQISSINEDQLHPTRLALGNLEELTQSIRHLGILTPLTVCQRNNRYDLIDGFRRFQVAKDLGIESVGFVVYENLSDAEILELSYTLNTKQSPLNPIEEASVYHRLKEDYGYTHEEIEISCGKKKTQISNSIGLLELPEETKVQVASGELTKSVVLELKKLKDPKLIKNAAKLAIANEWSQRKAKSVVERMNRKAKKEQKNEAPANIPAQDVPGVYFCDSKHMGDYVTAGSVPLILTSLGYMNGAEYEKGFSYDQLMENNKGILEASAKAVMPGGFIVINAGNITNFKGKNGNDNVTRIQPILPFYESCLRKHGLHLQDEIIWVKDFNSFIQDDAVNYTDDTPHTGYRIVNSHEFIWVFKKKGERDLPTDEGIILNSRISKEEWKAYAPSLWKINPAPKGQGHPNIFPDELARRIIKMFSFVGDTVVDPCLGSGTTFKIARELGRNAVGFERDLRYKAAIMEKLGVAEETKHESVKEYVDRQLEELEANQPEEPKMEVIMSEGMVEYIAETLGKQEEKEVA